MYLEKNSSRFTQKYIHKVATKFWNVYQDHRNANDMVIINKKCYCEYNQNIHPKPCTMFPQFIKHRKNL